MQEALQPTIVFRALLPLGLDDVWGLMWGDGSREAWLGSAEVQATDGGRFAIPGWASGIVRLPPPTSGSATLRELRLDGSAASLRVSLTSAATGLSVSLAVESTGIGPEGWASLGEFWRDACARLRTMVLQVRRRREHPHQAVLVIHGIGQQMPGETVLALLKGILGQQDVTSLARASSDRVSGLYDLHRWTIGATEDRTRPVTDFFEIYWAELMRGSTAGGTLAWVSRLLLRIHVPRQLLSAWCAAWLLAALVTVGFAVAVLLNHGIPAWLTSTSILVVAAGLAWRAKAAPFLATVIGDAARYLDPHTQDVSARQQIRQNAVRIVDRLHASGRYDRIVVVGHSLGAVIAYDALTFAWPRFSGAHDDPQHATSRDLRRVERRAAGASAQERQHHAWGEMQHNGQPWLVTDLVTLGNPMAHGAFLMADRTMSFDDRKVQGILPTCPPRLVQRPAQTQGSRPYRRCTYERGYRAPGRAGSATITVFDAASVFAPTRWTNLYFPSRFGGISGDPVGGPVAPQFGEWVRDVSLRSPVRLFAHGDYWLARGDASHLIELRRAIGLAGGSSLRRVLPGVPAHELWRRMHP